MWCLYLKSGNLLPRTISYVLVLTAEILAFPGARHNRSLERRGSHAALIVLNRSRAITLWETLARRFLVPHAMPNCHDYRAIPLMLRAERRAFHRAKDMSCDDTGAPLRAPAQAPQASPLRI